MNLNDKTKAITETALTTTLMVAFALIGLYIIPTVIIFYPIPFIVIGVRHGTKYNILAIVASTLIVTMLTNIIIGIILLTSFGFLAISFAYMLKRKYTPSQIMILNCGLALISMLLSITLFDIISGTSFIAQIEFSLNSFFALDLEKINTMGLSNYEISQFKDLLEITKDNMILLIPFSIMVSSVLTTYIVYWGSAAILRRFGYTNIKRPKLKLFNLPRNAILGSLVMILGSMIIKSLNLFYYETIFKNIKALILFVFFLQGFSVFVYFIDKLKFNKIVKVILIAMAVINLPLVALVGFIDVIFDLRKLRRAK